MATAEFSKFDGILSAALAQHHLLRFEIPVSLETYIWVKKQQLEPCMEQLIYSG